MTAPWMPPSRDIGFTGWLEWVRSLQAYGRDLETDGMVPHDPREVEPALRAEYLRTNILAAIDELMEALHETPWKPWAKDTEPYNEAQFVGEIVDALHFIGNALCLAAPMVAIDNPGTVADLYMAKSIKNAKRWHDGYRGRADKCPGCGRDKTELPDDHVTGDSLPGLVYCNYDGRDRHEV